MVIEFEEIRGKRLAALLAFVHSDENWVDIGGVHGRQMVIRVTAIRANNPERRTHAPQFETDYGLTLNIQEWLPKTGGGTGSQRVDPKYLLKVHTILGS